MKKSAFLTILLISLVLIGAFITVYVGAIDDQEYLEELQRIQEHNREIDRTQLRVDVVDEGMRQTLDEYGVPTEEFNPNDIQVTDALYTLILDPFERASEWTANMPNDQGIIKTRELWGAPRALQGKGVEIDTPWPRYRTNEGSYNESYFEERLIPDWYTGDPEGTDNIENLRILGVKVHFQRRGYNWFAVYPPNPYVLDGEVKSFSVWVCGRNKRHELHAIVRDLHGYRRFVSLGKLNFLGWKVLSVQVPTQIVQYDYRYDHRGLTFEGFLITCDLEDSWGSYYMYFDNLMVEINRYYEEGRDVYDPVDRW